MCDYDCHPLWEASPGEVGNIDPASLPITTDLRIALVAWSLRFDETLNRDDPRLSGFASEKEEASFKSEGFSLAERLRNELGPDYAVVVHI